MRDVICARSDSALTCTLSRFMILLKIKPCWTSRCKQDEIKSEDSNTRMLMLEDLRDIKLVCLLKFNSHLLSFCRRSDTNSNVPCCKVHFLIFQIRGANNSEITDGP